MTACLTTVLVIAFGIGIAFSLTGGPSAQAGQFTNGGNTTFVVDASATPSSTVATTSLVANTVSAAR